MAAHAARRGRRWRLARLALHPGLPRLFQFGIPALDCIRSGLIPYMAVSPELLEWCRNGGVRFFGIEAGLVAEGWRGVLATQELTPGWALPLLPPPVPPLHSRLGWSGALHTSQSEIVLSCWTTLRLVCHSLRGCRRCLLAVFRFSGTTLPVMTAQLAAIAHLHSPCRHMRPEGAAAAADVCGEREA